MEKGKTRFGGSLIAYRGSIFMFRFEKLEIWKLAIEYSNNVYSFADTLPRNEEFGLKSQLKRASLSISTNIAEGSGSATTKDFANFLDIAIKSTIETVSQLLFAKEKQYINESALDDLYEEAEKLVRKIYNFKHALKNRSAIRDSRYAKEHNNA